MNAWDIYWVLQLDSINDFFSITGFVLLFVAIIWLIVAAMSTDRGCYPNEDQDKSWAWLSKRAIWMIAGALPCMAIATFLPSTKTAAAMYVVPAIVNNQHIQHEAGDLYKLAKQALQQAVTSSDKK